MTLLLISVLVVLLVSAACSVSEAALYAVRRTYVRQIAEQGSRAGTLLLRFKDNMERPISAILIVNTVANTAGAAVAGAQAHVLFGDGALIWFSLAFTFFVLFLSEIMPKIVGVAYSRPVSRAVAMPWAAGIAMLFPAIWLIDRLARVLKPEHSLSAPEDEVNQLAMISAEEGSIMPYEADLVRNVLHLDNVTTRDIMTPRPVVMKLPSDMTLREVSEKVEEFTYSRIPVYDCDDPETWKGVVFSRDILAGLARDQFDTNLETLCSPIYFVSEKTPGNVLLTSFLKRRSHLFGVADEYGDITGIVTLEDVIESILGEEIVDEVDSAVDMQEVAQRRKRERKQGASASDDEDNNKIADV
jgi:CBS domain containing-hemolysin-like protein